jgi:hypothetical protein
MVFARNMVQVVEEMRAKGIVSDRCVAGRRRRGRGSGAVPVRDGIPAYAYSTEIPVAVLGAKYQWARGAGCCRTMKRRRASLRSASACASC